MVNPTQIIEEFYNWLADFLDRFHSTIGLEQLQLSHLGWVTYLKAPLSTRVLDVFDQLFQFLRYSFLFRNHCLIISSNKYPFWWLSGALPDIINLFHILILHLQTYMYIHVSFFHINFFRDIILTSIWNLFFFEITLTVKQICRWQCDGAATFTSAKWLCSSVMSNLKWLLISKLKLIIF